MLKILTKKTTSPVRVVPQALGKDHDFIDQQFAFGIEVYNNGNRAIEITEIGLIIGRKDKMPLKAALLKGINGLPANIQPGSSCTAVFHPEFDSPHAYRAAYIILGNGEVIEGTSPDLAVLNQE